MSIFKKLLLLVSATILCLFIAFCVLGYILISDMGNDAARDQLLVYSNVLQSEVEKDMQALHTLSVVSQNDSALARAVAVNDTAALRGIVRDLMTSPVVNLVTVCDAQGVVLFRGHSEKVGDTLPADRASLAVPLARSAITVGIEAEGEARLALVSGVPIRHEGSLAGVLIFGTDMASGKRVSAAKELLGIECTIFTDDTRVTTTVMNQGKPAINTKLNNDEIYKKVMQDGEKVLSRNMILGEEYDTVYWPWKNIHGKNAGMFFVGLTRNAIEKAQEQVIFYFVLAGVLIGALMLAGGVLMARAIVRPLLAATRFAESVAQGDLDGSLAVTTRDEVGALSRSLGSMVATLKEKIHEAEEQSVEAAAQAKAATQAMEEAAKAKETAENGQKALLRAAENVEQVVSRLTTAVGNINDQVDASTRQVAFQHDQVTTSATAMEEMNATVLEVAKNTSTAAESSGRAMQKAREGEDVVRESITSITQVQQETKHLRTAMRNLGDQANSIGAVMTIINDIADQTNLLALNAAIEAARAGDAGRGFAVVADEVRKLAEKTMEATSDVAHAINGIQAGAKDSIDAVDRTGQNLEATTHLVNRSGESLREIVAESMSMSDQINSIATASEQQAAASEEITRSLGEINVSASETAAAMQTSASATQELAEQARQLQELVQHLRT